MHRLDVRRAPQAFIAVCLLALAVGWLPLYAQPTNEGPPVQLGPAPSLTADQVRALTTVNRAAGVVPRAAGQSRTDVVSLFNSQYTPALQVPDGWTGSVAGCVPGTTSAAFEAATIQMVN